jgi:PKD repeat protein
MAEHRIVDPRVGGSKPLAHPGNLPTVLGNRLVFAGNIASRMKRILVLVLAGLACGENPTPVHDAAVERPVADTAQRIPDGPPALVVDFSVEGCPAFDPDNPTCTGAVPLVLQFVPMVTAPVTQYIWIFGDNSTSIDNGPTPSHVYTLPGVYTVTLVVLGEDGAYVTKIHDGFVTATASPLGAPCNVDSQCADKLFCLCPAGSQCDHGPAQGMCTALCQSGTCDDGQVCARLATSPSGITLEPWETSLCLPGCSTDDACRNQLRCRTVPVVGAWGKACFSDTPSDVGASCLDAKSALRDDLCVGGTCAGLGAKGLCTMDCSTSPCPPGSDCAMLGDGITAFCLRPCTTNSECAPDPLISCRGPGSGALGYQLVDPSAPDATANHCAPKECSSNQDCLPSGRCDAPAGVGHCVVRTD